MADIVPDIVIYTDYLPLPKNVPIVGVKTKLLESVFTYVPTQNKWETLSGAVERVSQEYTTVKMDTEEKGYGVFMKKNLSRAQSQLPNPTEFDEQFAAGDIPIAIYCGSVVRSTASHYVMQIKTSDGNITIDGDPTDALMDIASKLGSAYRFNNRCEHPNCRVKPITLASETDDSGNDKFINVSVVCLQDEADKNDELTYSYGSDYVKKLNIWVKNGVKLDDLKPCLCLDCENHKKEWVQDERWKTDKKGLEQFIMLNRNYMRK